MTAAPDRFGPQSGLAVAFAPHPAALRPDALARRPAYGSPPRPAAAPAPPWVSPYGPRAWALPRAEDWQLPVPPALPSFPALAPKPAPIAPSHYPATVSRRRRAATGLGLVAAGFAAAALLLSRPRAQPPVAAVFTAPRLIQRAAAADGHTDTVTVQPNAAPPPQTALPTIRLALDPVPAPPTRTGLIDAAMVLPLPDIATPPQVRQPPHQGATAATRLLHRVAARLRRRGHRPLRQSTVVAVRHAGPSPAACPAGQAAMPIASAR